MDGGGSLPARSLPLSLDESSAKENSAGGLDKSTTSVDGGKSFCGEAFFILPAEIIGGDRSIVLLLLVLLLSMA